MVCHPSPFSKSFLTCWARDSSLASHPVLARSPRFTSVHSCPPVAFSTPPFQRPAFSSERLRSPFRSPLSIPSCLCCLSHSSSSFLSTFSFTSTLPLCLLFFPDWYLCRDRFVPLLLFRLSYPSFSGGTEMAISRGLPTSPSTRCASALFASPRLGRFVSFPCVLPVSSRCPPPRIARPCSTAACSVPFHFSTFLFPFFSSCLSFPSSAFLHRALFLSHLALSAEVCLFPIWPSPPTLLTRPFSHGRARSRPGAATQGDAFSQRGLEGSGGSGRNDRVERQCARADARPLCRACEDRRALPRSARCAYAF